MLNLDQVATFIIVVEQGSFSAAARYLKKSQGGISTAIANLEIDLGISLFDRTVKYPILTEHGERFYQQAKVLIRQAERITGYAQSKSRKEEDRLTVALSPLLPFSTIETALEKLSVAFPFVQVHIKKLPERELHQSLLNGETDLGLQMASQIPEHLEFVSVQQLEWVCVCSPDSDFADMEFVDNDVLLAQRQIICSSIFDNNALRDMGCISFEYWQADSLEGVARLIEQGIGWGMLPKSVFEEKKALGTLIQFRPEFSKVNLYSVTDVIWKAKHELGPALAFLLKILKDSTH